MSRAERKPTRDEKAGSGGDGSASGRLSGRLSSLVQRGGGLLVDRLASSVKEASRSALLKQALDARERGNLAAAFHLLVEEHGGRPEDGDVSMAFWDIAVAYDRAEDAREAVSGLIRRHATNGGVELASQYWIELISLLPDALVEAPTLARIVPQLQALLDEIPSDDPSDTESKARASNEAALLAALRAMVAERNTGLTPGLALHAAELAREMDPATALSAARIALASDDLHEAKRTRLTELVAELDPDAEPARPMASPEEASPTRAPRASELPPVVESGPEPPLEPEEPSAAPGTESAAAPEAGADSRPPEICPADPARNHPLRTHSPPEPDRSDDEIEALRESLHARLANAVAHDAHPSPPEGRSGECSETPAILAGEDARLPGAEPAMGLDVDDELEIPSGDEDLALEIDENAVTIREADVQLALGLEDSESPTPFVESTAAVESDPGPSVICGVPVAIDDCSIFVAVEDGRQTQIAFDQVEALAVAEVRGLAEKPVVVIDLLLNWKAHSQQEPLRIVRIRSDTFDPLEIVSTEQEHGAALRSILCSILAGSAAIPLPDPDGALGLILQSFDSLEHYQRDVLQIGR